MKKILLALSGLILTSAVTGAEKEPRYSAHEHGVAQMNLAKLSKEVQIELIIPAFNLLGFEHEPNSKDQETMVDRTRKILNKPSELFIFEDSTCAVEHVSVTSPFEGDHDNSQHKEHEKHEKEHKHESDEKSAKSSDDSHSEYVLEYHFDCEFSTAPLNVDTTALFVSFPNFSKIRVQWLSENKQGSTELTPKQQRILLK